MVFADHLGGGDPNTPDGGTRRGRNPNRSRRKHPEYFCCSIVSWIDWTQECYGPTAKGVAVFLAFGLDDKPDPTVATIRGAALETIRVARARRIALWHDTMRPAVAITR